MRYWGVRLGSIVLGVAACFAIEAFSRSMLSDYAQRLVVLAGLYVTLSVSLNLINGITGQFSIGHAAFYQIGAYTGAYLSVMFYPRLHVQGLLWLLLMMGAGLVAAAIAGFVVGLPSLRLRGDYLAIVTLGFGEIIRIFVQSLELPDAGGEMVGGPGGMDVEPRFRYVWLVWLLAFLCIAVCRNLLKTAHGLPFLAVREDEVASAASGVNVSRTKVTAFVLGSAFAGAAGVLLAHSEGFISPDMFKMDLSFILLTMVVLGGTGSITGSLVAALALFYVPEYLRGLKDANGLPLQASGATLLAGIVGVILAVYLIKRLADHYHAPSGRKAVAYALALLATIVVGLVLRAALGYVPALVAAQYQVEKLRMVIFAATLIILMLLRPQGIFAHHEFSWTHVGRLWRRATVRRAPVL